jgi:hypothetical protein
MKKFIVSISFTVFFLFISVDANGKCQANSETQTKTPLQVLNVFYTVLVDDNHDTLPNIFININFAAKMITGREYNDIKAKKIVRQYLRQNKALFLFSLQNIKPQETINKVNVGFLFSNFIQAEVFYNGRFSITLSAPLDRRADSSVRKIIAFPFECQKSYYGRRYLIDITAITINGFSILPFVKKERYRACDLYKDLGFK